MARQAGRLYIATSGGCGAVRRARVGRRDGAERRDGRAEWRAGWQRDAPWPARRGVGGERCGCAARRRWAAERRARAAGRRVEREGLARKGGAALRLSAAKAECGTPWDRRSASAGVEATSGRGAAWGRCRAAGRDVAATRNDRARRKTTARDAKRAATRVAAHATARGGRLRGRRDTRRPAAGGDCAGRRLMRWRAGRWRLRERRLT
jgi:hypothetical protein